MSVRSLLLTVSLLVLPSPVAAQALSPWVQGVLDKAQAGLSAATQVTSTDCSNTAMNAEIVNNLSALRSLVTAARDLALEGRRRAEQTVCFESDRERLESRLDELRDALHAATITCNVAALRLLRTTYEFTADAYLSFLAGGLNPQYRDVRLQYHYPFEDPSAWQPGGNGSPDAFENDPDAPVCAFTTDYLPHSLGAFPGGARSIGCDETVLVPIASQQALQAEAVAAINFQRIVSDYARSVLAVFDPGALPAPPAHAVQVGCLVPTISDSAETQLAEAESADATFPFAAQVTGLSAPSPAEASLVPGALFTSLNDSFLLSPPDLSLNRSFLESRGLWGASRPTPSLGSAQTFFGLLSGQRQNQNDQTDSANTERELAVLESLSRDPLELSAEAAKPLREAMDSLKEVTQEFLPKQYVPSVAYLLARSCVDGTCQRQLETVLQRSFNPYCHPYTSGKFLEDDAAKKCFCDPSVQASDAGFWNEYCDPSGGPDLPPDQSPPDPVCVEGGLAPGQ